MLQKNYTSIAFVAFPDLLKAAYKFLSQIKHFDKSWPKNAAMGEEGVKICEKLLTSFMHGPKVAKNKERLSGKVQFLKNADYVNSEN